MKDGKPMEKKRGKLSLRNIFYHNTFVLVFSFAIALVTWFVMAYNSDMNRTFTIQDVPIVVVPSTEAEADGLRVFNMSYAAADIDVSGNSLITSKLTAEDFNWVSIPCPTGAIRGEAKIRHSRHGAPAEAQVLRDGRVRVRFDTPQRAVTPGQSVVLYDGDMVLGGGIIAEAE